MRVILGTIVFILMALPLAWFYVAMYWGFTITKDIAAFQRGEDVTLPVIPPLDWLNDRKDLRETYSPDALTSGRTISYRIAVPFVNMLEPGEQMPDRAFKELYATLRAPAYFLPLCDEMLGTLALACEVGSFEADVRHLGEGTSRFDPAEYPEDGLAILSAHLRYIPAYEMGNPSLIQNGAVEAVRIKLHDGQEIENTVEGRQEVVAEALALCRGLRVTFGNCVIRNVTFDPQRDRSDPPEAAPRLRVSASFSVTVDKTRYRRQAVQAALNEVAASRLAAIETMQRFLP